MPPSMTLSLVVCLFFTLPTENVSRIFWSLYFLFLWAIDHAISWKWQYLLEVSREKDSQRACKYPGSDHERSMKLEIDLWLALQLGHDSQSLKKLETVKFMPQIVQSNQMAILLFNLWTFSTVTIYQVAYKCQSRYKILPNSKKIHKKAQRLLKFCQSGEISPNMITLNLTKAVFAFRQLEKFFYIIIQTRQLTCGSLEASLVRCWVIRPSLKDPSAKRMT